MSNLNITHNFIFLVEVRRVDGFVFSTVTPTSTLGLVEKKRYDIN